MPEFFVTTHVGFEQELADDLTLLTGRPARADWGRAFVEGPTELVYDLNYGTRVGQRVFVLVARGTADTLDDVERVARDVPWEDWFPGTKRFGVEGIRVRDDDAFTRMDVAARVGDAIIGRFGEATGDRPPVDLNAPEVQVHAILRDDDLVLGLNTTGASLHFRNYKHERHPAPLAPTLAAALLHLSGYPRDPGPLGDLMAGTATIPIEAALMARRIPAGRFRPDFSVWKPPSPGEQEEGAWRKRLLDARKPPGYAFGHLHLYEEEAWEAAKKRLEGEAREACPPLWANDRKYHHVRAAKSHAAAAGVEDAITFTRDDARKVEPPFPLRYVVLNPPYGVRVGERDHLENLYRKVQDRLEEASKQGPLSVAVLVGNHRFEEQWSREPTVAHDGAYGRLHVRALRYDL